VGRGTVLTHGSYHYAIAKGCTSDFQGFEESWSRLVGLLCVMANGTWGCKVLGCEVLDAFDTAVVVLWCHLKGCRWDVLEILEACSICTHTVPNDALSGSRNNTSR
jgi:hypothetical protein